ncbi:MAG TPA: sensor domain-containing phosphodiesterase [Acidimicrobiales bacterium]
MAIERRDKSTTAVKRSNTLRVWSYIGAASVAALTVGVIVVVSSSPPRFAHHIPWPLLAVSFVATSAFPMKFHVRRQTVQFDLFELAFVAAAVSASPGGVLLALLCFQVASLPQYKWRPDRLVLNTAASSLSVAVSLAVFYSLMEGSAAIGPSTWPALVMMPVIYGFITSLVVFGVITISGGFPGWAYLRSWFTGYGLVLPLNAALAIVAATVASTQPWALLPLTGTAVLLTAWYRRADKIRSRYSDLQKLYGFTVKLAEQSEGADLITTALTEARNLLHAMSVGVYLPGKTGMVLYQLDAEGEVKASHQELPQSLRKVAKNEGSIVIARGKHPAMLADVGLSDLIAAPIDVGIERLGVLVIGEREGSRATFDNDDRLFAEALAANMGTALTSVRRHDALQESRIRREFDLRHDDLTGLPNRSEFSSQLSGALAKRQQSEMMAVVLMDLDGFKEINDTVGHDIGDVVLQQTAIRLREVAGDKDVVARLGGDEFALLIPQAESIDGVLRAAEMARDAVSRPIREKGLVLDLRASVGVAIVPLHRDDPLKCAEVAMYEAKRSHGGIVTYDQAIDHNTTRKLLLATELRRAMSADELEVYYQPVADLRTGEIRGFEALLRWRHEHYGSVSPSEFIPVAEKTGLINELTWWVLGRALRELRRWQDDGYEFSMAVNLSARSLMDKDLVGRLRLQIEDIGVRPGSVQLEITESSIMVDPDRSEKVLQELADLGVELAIDDYGTEYSSLSRLQRLPVTTVKIDRSFVMHMCSNDRDEKIVRATIYLAHTLGQRVIAEGVEDLTTWERLTELGCDEVQGYYLSAPIPAEQCRLWVRNRQPARLAPVRHLRPVAGA